MAKSARQWMRVRKLTPLEKAAAGAACDHFIAEKLVPRFLPRITPTEFNYVVGLHGRWHGSKYRFIQRYRSGFPDNLGDEFDAPFTRLDHDEHSPDGVRFHVMWHRHTGQWFQLYSSLTLEQALSTIETDGKLQPHC